MSHRTIQWLAGLFVLAATGSSSLVAAAAPISLFDGKTFEGWEGDLKWFRIEDRAIVAGTLEKPISRNEFLCTRRSFTNFVLQLEFKLQGSDQANAGVQIRTSRIPDHHEVIGYQADIGQQYWGALYDESRRRKILASPAPERLPGLIRKGDWNRYEIHCEGPRIRLKLNGEQTVDYTETDAEIPRHGVIALQVHSGPPMEVRYRNITLKPLP